VSAGAKLPVILMRHSHADWPDYNGRDFDRPLTPLGEAEAAAAGQAIHAAGDIPSLVLSSPAVRTRQTASIVATQLGLDETAIVLVDGLYNASTEILEAELCRASAAAAGTVMLVAHNPGISELARRLGRDASFRSFAPAHWQRVHLGCGDPLPGSHRMMIRST
jgi:phosphohistidine phosphatase